MRTSLDYYFITVLVGKQRDLGFYGNRVNLVQQNDEYFSKILEDS